MSDFSTRLLRWFDDFGRKDLPWQHDVTPYRVWVSEIMLQQTQVQTVVPYFNAFTQRFPDIASLASADQDAVLSHWSGLGYYARARNLHKAAQIICVDHGGRFPEHFDDVLDLPGIGRSTAGAVLSLAHNQRHAILDGNVKRVLARHGAVEGWPGSSKTADTLWVSAEDKTPYDNVAKYTQAIMDLGATLCTRSKPDCGRCPVSDDCAALRLGVVNDFPNRKPKARKPLRSTVMILANVDDRVYLERRPEAGIWGGLWSLPELGDRSLDDWCFDALHGSNYRTQSWQILRHSFSHFDLDIQPIVVRFDSYPSKVADVGSSTWYKLDEAPPGGLAAPVKKLIEQLKKSEDVAYG